ncbi:MAG: PhoX family phosphatase [Planctomycetota bacterium]
MDSQDQAWADEFPIIEDGDDRPARRPDRFSMGELIERRISRREALSTMLATAAATTVPMGLLSREAQAAAGSSVSTVGIQEIENVITTTHRVSAGYTAKPLIRWGDPLFTDSPEFDPDNLNAESQVRQFGYNNDFIAYMPLPRGSENSSHGLLCVNHEYTCPWLMYPGIQERSALTTEEIRNEMAAHGHSVVEIERGENGEWEMVPGSPYNRRITADAPRVRIAGPAAGHDRLKTSQDPEGLWTVGTINNCAGGFTPWGTVLIAEENFNSYFAGDASGTSEADNHDRYGVGGGASFDWRLLESRFDVENEPHEANRYGWVVEYNPYDPESTPVKRTTLGRIKHEGATTIINKCGRLVVYMGDDQVFEHIYKFVSRDPVDMERPEKNRDLLDEGTLYVAKFEEDGSVDWLPLVHGQGPLTEANGFGSQGEVLIETRRAADLLGATPMDRPEDVEPNPATGRVYAMLTNNKKRESADTANPRARNIWGHIIEIVPPGAESGDSQGAEQADHASTKGTWNIFLRAGDPSQDESGSVYHPDVSRDGWLMCPDNCAFDNKGRLYIATDQGSAQARSGSPDGIRITDTTGQGRALTKLFFACPVGAEMCGPCFTPDSTTMFVAVQHPGDSKGSTFENPSTRWPGEADSKMPPRPSVVAITKNNGGLIGD